MTYDRIMAPKVATEDRVGLPDLIDFIEPRHHWVLSTTRQDDRPQMSPVTGGIDEGGRLLIATYPARDKCRNIRRNPAVTVCVQSDHFGGAWVQVDGQATVIDMPEALEGLVEYYRTVSGEHPNWDEYRAAMERQGKSLIVIEIERWGPIATGGFPASVASILAFAESHGESADDAPA